MDGVLEYMELVREMRNCHLVKPPATLDECVTVTTIDRCGN